MPSERCLRPAPTTTSRELIGRRPVVISRPMLDRVEVPPVRLDGRRAPRRRLNGRWNGGRHSRNFYCISRQYSEERQIARKRAVFLTDAANERLWRRHFYGRKDRYRRCRLGPVAVDREVGAVRSGRSKATRIGKPRTTWTPAPKAQTRGPTTPPDRVESCQSGAPFRSPS